VTHSRSWILFASAAWAMVSVGCQPHLRGLLDAEDDADLTFLAEQPNTEFGYSVVAIAGDVPTLAVTAPSARTDLDDVLTLFTVDGGLVRADGRTATSDDRRLGVHMSLVSNSGPSGHPVLAVSDPDGAGSGRVRLYDVENGGGTAGLTEAGGVEFWPYEEPLLEDCSIFGDWMAPNRPGDTFVAACGDMTRDGGDDLCVGQTGLSDTPSGQVTIFELADAAAMPAGGFLAVEASAASSIPHRPCWPAGWRIAGGADLTGDDRVDLAVAYHGAVAIHSGPLVIQDQFGVRAAVLEGPISGGRMLRADPLAVVDANGDGIGDIIASAVVNDRVQLRGYLGPFEGEREVDVPDFIFDRLSVESWQGADTVVDVGDLNDDGHRDLAIGAGRLFVLYGPYDSSMDLDEAPLQISGFPAKDPSPAISVAGGVDLNGDGIHDLVVGAPQGYSRESTGDGPTAEHGRVFVYFGG
jgi:hypothetical protein